MSDVIGRITVPSVSPTATFPLVTDFAHGKARKRQVITHTFGAADAKIEQRYYYGDPAMRYVFHRQFLSQAARKQLRDFFDEVQGPNVPFYYAAPNEDQTTTTKTVVFDNAPLTLEDLTNATCSAGLTFVEVPSVGPTYTVNATVTRFPGTTLGTALQAQAQEIIPLVRIRVLDSNVPDIFLSDRRVTIGSQLYLPRLLRMNEPGGGAILTQSIDGSTDDVTLTFGNADRVMVQVANDTQLRWARVELSLFHVDDPVGMTGTILQLWAGYAIDWKSDAGPEFTLKASDILSALTLSSPVGCISRTCWRRYQLDGCPATGTLDAAHFPSASATSCDQGYNTPNGCMAHGANQFYGATYCSPQTVILRSGGLGFTAGTAVGMVFGVVGGVVGSLLDTVSTWYPMASIVADNIFGGTIPEIWHNDDGQAQYGLPVACKIAAGRDEDQFYIALGIVGRGPLGAFTPPQMWTSYGATQPDTFMGSTLDGMPNHGFQVGSNGVLKSGAIPTYGLRQTLGADPSGAHDYFSLGRVSGSGSRPAGWFTQAADGSLMDEIEYPAWDGQSADTTSSYNLVYSAATSVCEIRRTKASNEGLSSPGQHTLIALVSQGLTGFGWYASGGGAPGPAGPFAVREADPENLQPGGNYQSLNLYTLDDVSALRIGDLITVAGNSSTNINYGAAPQNAVPMVVTGIYPGSAPTGNLIQLATVLASGTPYGMGGTATVTPVAGGVRYPIPACTNPFWVAINTYLRAIGMIGAASSTQTQYFDVNAAAAAAAIADTVVPVILGTGNEVQFRFKGSIDDRKPTRDWIQSILNTALGYYTWSFGSLKVGCRSNASAVSAYTAGNILFQSLKLNPVSPKFEKLTVQFSDQYYQFQSNAIDYVDQDLAARDGRIQNPLAQQFPVMACPSISQAARLSIGRAREEMGGAVQAEQDAARIATWKSTILALDTDAGSVVSITDADVPGGVMDFRVTSMRVNSDWSVDLIGKTVTASMYDETVGPKPASVLPPPVPTAPVHDSDLPPSPTFAAEVFLLDPSQLELTGLTFSDSANTDTINRGVAGFYYCDPAAPTTTLAAALGTGDTSMTLVSAAGISAGSLVQIGQELVLCGAPTGTVFPIARAQLGTGAGSASIGDNVFLLACSVSAFSLPVVDSPEFASWSFLQPLAGMRAAFITLCVINIYGSSPIVPLLLVTGSSYGLQLSAAGAVPAAADQSYSIVNGTSSPSLSGNGTTGTPFVLTAVQQILNVVATSQDVYLLLPDESVMPGKDITVNLAAGSTHSVWMRPHTSGDDVAGSSSDYQIAQPNCVTIEGL